MINSNWAARWATCLITICGPPGLAGSRHCPWSLLDQAITLDNNINKEENRKRKFSKNHTEPFHKKHHSSEGSGSHNSHKHNGHFSKGNGDNYNGHKHNEGFKGDHSNSHPNGNNGRHNGGNGHHNGNNGQHRHNSRDLSHITCFKCKKTRHFADRCTEKKHDEVIKPNPFQKGQVNHLHVEEVVNEPNTVMGRDFPRATYLAVKTMVCGGDLRFILVEWPQGYIPGSENHDSTQDVTTETRCSGGDDGVDGGDDDDDDPSEVQLDDGDDGDDFPLREGISPADFCPPESSFLSGVSPPRRGGCVYSR
ncbi:hypothetical protein QYE76_059439 [Lolium multiflorum]|uniref:CCHC-type domain-containing protein n=1 Tax=Lolium multiflorum TaxID=4521 RepID=A0AAD8RY12_LOLMU|nr:hypothetical protein QYE76_059439 [Lolium multiflorum]